jgi:uncharacterized protein involved in outer membrane biogenesis
MRWKWIIGIVAGVILACLVAIIVIVSAYDFNKFKPDITGVVGEYTGRELTLAGDIKLAISLYPTLVVDDVAFQNASWGSRPNMITAKHIEVQVGLISLIRGHIKVERLDLVGADYIIETDKNGKSNMEFDIPDKPTTEEEKESQEDALALFGFKKITVKDGKLTFRDYGDDTTHVLVVKEYTRDTDDFGADSEMQLVGSYNDKPIKFHGNIGPLGHVLDPSKKWDFDLSAEAFDTKITIAGHIQDVLHGKGIDINLSAKGDDLMGLQAIIGELLPFKGPFTIAGHVVTSEPKKTKVSDLKIVIGGSQISGSMVLDQSSKKPHVTAELASETLDLRPVLAQGEQPNEKTEDKRSDKQKRPGKVFSDAPFALEGLHKVNANIDIKIKQMLMTRLAFDNVQTKIVLKDGHLSVDPLTTGGGEGGSLDSYLSLLAKGNQAHVEVKVNIKQMDLGEMLKRLDITDALEGTLDLEVHLLGEGDSVATLMAGLNGDVVAILGEGKMPVRYLNVLGGDLGKSLTQLINPFSEKIDRAHINCAVCDLNITDGAAKSDVIVLDDPRKTIVSKGEIDLRTEQLDFGIFTKPKEGIGTKETGKISISLSEITKPFKLGGTLAEPSLQIDPTRSVKTIGTALLGPAGIAYLLVSRSTGDESPCAKALEVAGEGVVERKDSRKAWWRKK